MSSERTLRLERSAMAASEDDRGSQEPNDVRVRKADRFGRILELLAEDGSVAVADLARELRVSNATVRRDLRSLSDQHLVERMHGGAVSHGTIYELPVRYRSGHARDEKQRIARAAA